jgi:PAS domain S-box-containing protein
MVKTMKSPLVLILILILSPAVAAQEEYSSILTVERTGAAPVVDGVAKERTWESAKFLRVPVVDGKVGDVDVQIKGLYDDEYIYIYATWPDPTKSDTLVWRYNGTNWIPPNKTSEDMFSFFWNIDDSVEGFNVAGCAVTCHGDRMRTNTPEERVDYWKWQAAKTNPAGYARDGYLDNALVLNETVITEYTHYEVLKKWHAHKLDSTFNLEKTRPNALFDSQGREVQPRYYEPNGMGEDVLSLTQEEVEKGEAVRVWEGVYPNNTLAPAYISQRPAGSAGDIKARGTYSNGAWHLELKRRLITDSRDDVQFDTSRTYRFSIAVNDDSHGAANEEYGQGHSISMLALTMEFGGEGSKELGQLVLIRDYLVSAKAYIERGDSGLAFSEVNNAKILYNQIGDAVAERDPALYLKVQRAFSEFKRNPTGLQLDAIIGGVDDIVLTFQGKRTPEEPTWDLKLIVLWGKVQLYVFLFLALLGIYPLFKAFQIGTKPVFRRMSIFLLIVLVPILLEGVGRFGILTGITTLQNFSFMTNEYATLLWAVLMMGGLLAARAGFGEVDRNITSLQNYGIELEKKVDEIQRLKGYIENVVENSPIGIAVVDRSGKTTYSNPVFQRMMGIEQMGVTSVTKFPQLKEMVEECQGLKQGESTGREEVNIRKDLILSVSGAPLYNAHGDLEGVVLLIENITERKKLERRLFQSEKLASVGQMAAGVAHEINNPLTSISLNAQTLLSKEEDEAKREKLAVIETQVDSVAKIIRDLLDFSRQLEPAATQADVNGILDKTLEVLSFQMKGIDVRRDFSKLPKIQADISQLRQVFTNMIINATHAMPDGGTLTIKTEVGEGGVYITFSDTGHGIPKENIDRIFDPFFTTKGIGKGTGLGLSICHGIVEAHHGHIEVQSEVEKGTTFRIWLPMGENGEG